MTHRAFTLVELLVVVAIMITLMGLIMGGVMLAKKAAMRAKSVEMLGSLAAAVDQYRSLNNVYPEYWKKTATPPAEWTTAAANSSWLGGLADGDEVYGKAFSGGSLPGNDVWEGINVHLVWQLGSLISDKAGKDGMIRDAYKMPLRYRPSKWYPLTASDPVRINSDKPPGLDSYQLWSAGPDGKDDANPGEGGDDIPQWARQ